MTNRSSGQTTAGINVENIAAYENRYNRPPNALEAAIIQKWASLVGEQRSILTFPDIPEKKLENALSNYGSDLGDELILGLQDSSTLGSAKNGVLFTTEGIHWNLSETRSPMSVRYENLDADFVSYKTGWENKLILSREHKLTLMGLEGEEALKTLAEFVRQAIYLTPSKLPDECWEFAASVVDGEPRFYRKYRSKDEVKQAITSHAIRTYYLYRRYNRKTITRPEDKGEWKPIPDTFYENLGLEKQNLIEGEKALDRKTYLILGIVALILMAGVGVVLWLLFPNIQLPHNLAQWGRLIGGLLAIVVGSIVLARRTHPAVGVITFLAGLAFLIRSCSGS
jgi:hypothetical protein